MIKEIIIVEGVHDQQKLTSIYPDADCLVTNGSEISQETLVLIEQANQTRGVILFLDPDFPGKQIMNRILDRIPNVKIAFLNKKDAISKNKKKVGVEHASEADIRTALDHLFEVREDRSVVVTIADLFTLDLINHPFAAHNRALLCERLHLPFCNGKTLLKYVNMLDISLSRIGEVMQ